MVRSSFWMVKNQLICMGITDKNKITFNRDIPVYILFNKPINLEYVITIKLKIILMKVLTNKLWQKFDRL
ncbi:MAG: hypothetical protein CM15mV141_330 [uncultured marine virus]|nr:MAG: hypothetical protein CM15mV141_330 [uncultured marine virus]